MSCFNQDLDPAREIEWLSFFPDVAGVTSPIPDACTGSQAGLRCWGWQNGKRTESTIVLLPDGTTGPLPKGNASADDDQALGRRGGRSRTFSGARRLCPEGAGRPREGRW